MKQHAPKTFYTIVVYVPDSHVEKVKDALFETGAGQLGNYDRCCWQTMGMGQFRPGIDSNPFIGKESRLEKVAEFRLEMVCAPDVLRPAISALKAAHPYEAPAFHYWQVQG